MPTFGAPHTFGFGTFSSGFTPLETRDRLYRTLLDVLPQWFTSGADTRAVLLGLAAVFARVEEYLRDLHGELFVLQSDGVWTDEHARDVGLRRATGEPDWSLKARVRSVEAQVTVTSVLSVAQAIVDSDIGGTVTLIESRQLDPSTTIPDQAFEYTGQDFFMGQSRTRTWPLAGYFHLMVPAGISQTAFDAIIASLPETKAAGFGFVVMEDVGL